MNKVCLASPGASPAARGRSLSGQTVPRGMNALNPLDLCWCGEEFPRLACGSSTASGSRSSGDAGRHGRRRAPRNAPWSSGINALVTSMRLRGGIAPPSSPGGIFPEGASMERMESRSSPAAFHMHCGGVLPVWSQCHGRRNSKSSRPYEPSCRCPYSVTQNRLAATPNPSCA